MSLANRYVPSHPAGSSMVYSYDYSPILEPGSWITAAALAIAVNTAPPSDQSDFEQSEVGIIGRRLFAMLDGGVAGRDYRLEWRATDNRGNIWPRTALLLCAATS